MEKSISIPPFPIEAQIDNLLSVADDCHSPSAIKSQNDNGSQVITVPGHPLVDVREAKPVQRLLSDQFLTPRLDAMHRILWLVSTRKSDNVFALHRQIVHGREIIVAEDPGLHLIWYYERIYVKPIPSYLLNYAFWSTHLHSNDEETINLRRAVLGFMRTYSWLIQSEHDFYIAFQKGLVPAETTFADFIHFINYFRHVGDFDVSLRYREYGQLRLSRLNFWSKVYQGQLFYHRVDAQYGAYFARFTPPFLFIFGSVSVALSSMSVILAVNNGQAVKPNEAFAGVSNWFSVVCLGGFAAVLLFFPLLQVIFLLRELVYVVCNYKNVKR